MYKCLDFTNLSILNFVVFFEETFSFYSSSTFSFRSSTYFVHPVSGTITFTLKLVGGICFLIVIRGGVPRYRYDFLTKMGWVKFLTFIVTLFFTLLVINLVI